MNRVCEISDRKLHKTELAYFLHFKAKNEDEPGKEHMKFEKGVTLTRHEGK